MGIIIWVAKMLILGVGVLLGIPDILVNSRCWAQAYA